MRPEAPNPTPSLAPAQARHGWSGSLWRFTETEPAQIVAALQLFVTNSGPSQIAAWRESIRLLQLCAQQLIAANPAAEEWGLVLEYEVPLEARRADAVLLAGRTIIVLEFKGTTAWTDPAIDQTHAYARDLRCYHEACHEQTVIPVLVPTRSSSGSTDEIRGVRICDPKALLGWLSPLVVETNAPVTLATFLAAEAYRPLPSLIEAARELFQTGNLRRVHR